eukprot:scaffold327651_cov109-Tisochrysis_lutea.AAC.1
MSSLVFGGALLGCCVPVAWPFVFRRRRAGFPPSRAWMRGARWPLCASCLGHPSLEYQGPLVHACFEACAVQDPV